MRSWRRLATDAAAAGAAGTAGADFGAAGAGFCRASFSTSYEKIHEAGERIARFLDTIRKG